MKQILFALLLLAAIPVLILLAAIDPEGEFDADS